MGVTAGKERGELIPGWGLEPEHQHENPVIPHGWAATGSQVGAGRGGEGLQSKEAAAAQIKST